VDALQEMTVQPNIHNEGRALFLRASLSIVGLGVNGSLYW